MIVIEKVGAEAIPVVQQIVKITWPVAYGEILSADQLNYMLDMIYSDTSLQQQIKNGDQFVVAYQDEHPVAFASYSPQKKEAGIYKLHKIYILPTQQGKGIGNKLLDYIINDIAPATALKLNVNRSNKAISFYQKEGFKIIEEVDIPIGNGYYMNDYIMQLDL